MASPSEQCLPLRNHPIHSPIEIHDCKGRNGRAYGDEGCHWTRRGYLAPSAIAPLEANSVIPVDIEKEFPESLVGTAPGLS
jgi:hypothetical protein